MKQILSDELNIVYDEYVAGLRTLIEYLNSNDNDVVGFLGSGLSTVYNYKTWHKLIIGYNENGDKENDALVDFAQITLEEWSELKLEDGSYDLLKIAQLCYDKLGEDQWQQFIKKEYGNLDLIKIDVNSSYGHIIKSNYYCFITTNFDGAAFTYAESYINNVVVAVYPNNLMQVERKSINYLHGAGFEIIPDYVPQLILGEKEYGDAYTRNPIFQGFLSQLIKFDIAFIGFSLNDKYFELFLKQLENVRENMRNKNRGNSEIFDKKKFILLPYLPRKLSSKINYKDADLINIIAEEDKTFYQMGLTVIRYKKQGSDYFSSFKPLMEYIHLKAPNRQLLARPFNVNDYMSNK